MNPEEKKVTTSIKFRGGGVKALMARPLNKISFAASLYQTRYQLIENGYDQLDFFIYSAILMLTPPAIVM